MEHEGGAQEHKGQRWQEKKWKLGGTSRGLSIDLFLLNLEQKNGEVEEKRGSHLLTSPAASFLLDMIHDISARSGEGGGRGGACVLEPVRN